MTNEQFLVGKIKERLSRDDIEDRHRIRLLSMLGKHVRRRKKAKPAAKIAPVQKLGPFQRPGTAPATAPATAEAPNSTAGRPVWLEQEQDR